MNNEVSSDFSSISPTLPSNPTTNFLTSKSHKDSESKEHQEDIFDSLLRENNPLLFSQEIDTKIKLDSESLFQKFLSYKSNHSKEVKARLLD